MSVTAAAGFVASGTACGIKASGDLDLALVATQDARQVAAAGIFTTNKAPAAPVMVTRNHLASGAGRAAAVVVSSGNANAATGERGLADAERICDLTGAELGVAARDVLLCQTGLIGIPLPMKQIEPGIAALVEARAAGRDAAGRAARAIMTTDTVPKEVAIEGAGYLVGGMAKGAAMLAPKLATMLTVLTTDAACEPGDLATALVRAGERTFNRLTLDGCTSTNDTVLVLASGRSGTTPAADELASSLAQACEKLATMMAADAEGGTKVARVLVQGAATEPEAHRAAQRVAESTLVKCSLNGEDPYWGRVVSELGSAGVTFDARRVSVAYGGVTVCRAGIAAEHDAEALRAHMRERFVEITCDLDVGDARAGVLTCDLGYGYIDENRTTS